MAFIDAHRQEFGVEPICRVLTEQGIQIAPSTYYDARHRRPSKRALRDEQITKLINQARQHPFWVRFGARKMWLYLRSPGHDVARCTVERLMAVNGCARTLRGKRPVTNLASATDPRPTDLVDRDFTAAAPTCFGWPIFTYVPTWAGMAYLAFIFDVYSRMIVGWRASTKMTTELVLDPWRWRSGTATAMASTA